MKGIRLIIVLCLMAVTAACSTSNKDNEPTASESPVSSVQPSQPAIVESESPEGSAKITKAMYDKIKNGMTYKEVVEIIGSEVEKASETGEEGDDMYTFVVMYEGEGEPGAMATFGFIGDKLQTKSQFGLK